MHLYRDMSYCETRVNNCVNRDCKRHMDTNDTFMTLAGNKLDLPIAQADFSKSCNEFREMVWIQ